MPDPRTLYDLRHYARKLGYVFLKPVKQVTVPEGRRSARVEARLRSFGYAIQLNLFGEASLPVSVKQEGVKTALNLCNIVTRNIPW